MARPRRVEQLAEPIENGCEVRLVHFDAVRAAQGALPKPQALGRLSALFAALGDPTRLRIVAALDAHELCVCDIAVVVGLSESAVSHHLRQLRALGLVRFRREGRLVIYTLDDDHVASLFGIARDHVDHLAMATPG
jgi:ArsR family transcriptional regulator, lead/cadmium/zinc/bismuth-responsive transcriptional repressor